MRLARALLGAIVIALPALGVMAERAAIAPVGDALACALSDVATMAAPAQAPSVAEDERRVTLAGPKRTAARGEAPSARRRAATDEARDARDKEKDGGAEPASAALDAAPKGTIAVPAAVVSRAIAKRDVSATNATDAAGKPLGARLVGVSRYGAGLRDGDVVVSVAGTRTPTVDAMVAAAMSAAAGGAKQLRGKILRGDGIWAVTIEIPERPAP